MSAVEPNPKEHQAVPHYSARDLMKDSSHVHIEHEGQIYSLRITRAGKLILTK